jgi:hypothetical protein
MNPSINLQTYKPQPDLAATQGSYTRVVRTSSTPPSSPYAMEIQNPLTKPAIKQ